MAADPMARKLTAMDLPSQCHPCWIRWSSASVQRPRRRSTSPNRTGPWSAIAGLPDADHRIPAAVCGTPAPTKGAAARPVETDRYWMVEVVDLIAAAITVALRRADEIGDAITARGGAGQFSAVATRLTRRDWLVLGLCAATCLTAMLSELLWVSTV